MKSRDIETLLPSVFRTSLREGSPAKAILGVMEAIHEPSEQVLDTIDAYFDPWRAPDRFVPYLAHWLDLDRFLQAGETSRRGVVASSIPLPQLREWIAAAAWLSRWRGTAKGLTMLLEAATGAIGFHIHEGTDRNGAERPFHLRVVAPREAEPHRALIERIIRLEKPAYMTADSVEFDRDPEPGSGS